MPIVTAKHFLIDSSMISAQSLPTAGVPPARTRAEHVVPVLEPDAQLQNVRLPAGHATDVELQQRPRDELRAGVAAGRILALRRVVVRTAVERQPSATQGAPLEGPAGCDCRVDRIAAQDHRRGSHRYRPAATSTRNSRLAAAAKPPPTQREILRVAEHGDPGSLA